jgi:hypothetical protein
MTHTEAILLAQYVLTGGFAALILGFGALIAGRR